jgi:proteasome accessory factor A
MKDKTTISETLLQTVPKLCGADVELGNFILGLNGKGRTGFEASRLLLREIDGLPRASMLRSRVCECAECRGKRRESKSEDKSSGFNPQDWGRKFLPSNGGCVYIDLDHLEICLPEVMSAYDHVAAWRAMLEVARRALRLANAKLPPELKIQVLVNNSDGGGNSYGSHLNFLVTRRAWENIFNRRIHYLLYLASYQVSSIIFTGQGKVGSENGAPPVAFQLSQRADFFETLMGTQTTFNRPIVNSRDEAHCGRESRWRPGPCAANEMARLHVIFFDSTLAEVASLLKVGVMQIILAMIEAERVNTGLILDDPVEAVVRWSHDLTFKSQAQTMSGRKLTAVELQLLFLEEAKRFVDSGRADGLVPRASEILALWEDTLVKLGEGDHAALARRLDWALKLSILEQAMHDRPGLDWDNPQIKYLDHLYSSLDYREGLYWAYERGGFVERVIGDELPEYFLNNPPEDTRAWARAMLLRRADAEAIEDVDWDGIKFRLQGRRPSFVMRTIEMANPLAFTKEMAGPLFEQAETLEDLLDGLEAATDEAMMSDEK